VASTARENVLWRVSVNADGDVADDHGSDVTAASASNSSSAQNGALGALLEFGD
jgi:hypothetical protein